MTIKLAILCSGQGEAVQDEHFAFARGEEQGRAVLAEVEAQLGASLQTCLAARTQNQQMIQPVLLSIALANWHSLASSLPRPALVAGYSLGELSAHAIAGRISVTQAVQLAQARAQAMQTCLDGASAAQGMLAIHGLAHVQILALCANSAVHCAIQNGETSFIVAGSASHLRAFAQRLPAHARVSPVHVAIAAHTPLMHGALAAWQASLAHCAWQASSVPVIAGIDGSLVKDSARAQATLSAQLCLTVRWDLCMDAIAEAGISHALELGPGTALSRMLATRHPQIACRALAEFKSVLGVEKWLGVSHH